MISILMSKICPKCYGTGHMEIGGLSSDLCYGTGSVLGTLEKNCCLEHSGQGFIWEYTDRKPHHRTCPKCHGTGKDFYFKRMEFK